MLPKHDDSAGDEWERELGGYICICSAIEEPDRLSMSMMTCEWPSESNMVLFGWMQTQILHTAFVFTNVQITLILGLSQICRRDVD